MSRRYRNMARPPPQTEQDFHDMIKPTYTGSVPPPTSAEMKAHKDVAPPVIQPQPQQQPPPSQEFFQPTIQPGAQSNDIQQQVPINQPPQNKESGVFDIFKPQTGTVQGTNFPSPNIFQPPSSEPAIFNPPATRQSAKGQQQILAQTGAPLTTPATHLSNNNDHIQSLIPPIVTPSQPIQQLQAIKEEQDKQNLENHLNVPQTTKYQPQLGISDFFNPSINNQQGQNTMPPQMEESIPQASTQGDILDNYSDSHLDQQHLGGAQTKNESQKENNNINIPGSMFDALQVQSKENTEQADQQSSITQSQQNNLPITSTISYQQSAQHNKTSNCNMCGMICDGIVCNKCYQQLNEENQKYKNQVSEQNNQIKYFEMENATLQEQYDTLHTQHQQVEEQLSKANHQVQTLTYQNEVLQKQQVQTSETISNQQLNQQKLEFNKQIQQKNEQIQSLIIDQQKKDQQYTLQTQQIQNLQKQLQRYEQTSVATQKLHDQLAAKSEELVQLQYKIQQCNTKITQLQQETTDNANKINQLKQENMQKDEQLRNTEIEKNKLKEEINDIQTQFDEQIEVNEQKEEQIKRYQTQLQDNKSQINDIQRMQQENNQLSRELIKLQQQHFKDLPKVNRQNRENHFTAELQIKKMEFPLTSLNEHLLIEDINNMIIQERSLRDEIDKQMKQSGQQILNFTLPSHLELILYLFQTKLDYKYVQNLIYNLLTGIFDEFEGKTDNSEVLIQIQLFLFSGEVEKAIQLAKDNSMHDMVYYLLTRNDQDEQLREQRQSYITFIRRKNQFEYFEFSPKELLNRRTQLDNFNKHNQYNNFDESNNLHTDSLNNISGYYELGLGLSCLLLGEINMDEFLNIILQRYKTWNQQERQFASMCVGFPLMAHSGFEYVELYAQNVSFKIKQRFIPKAVRHLSKQFRMPHPINWIASLIYQYITGRNQVIQQLHSVKLSNKMIISNECGSPSKSEKLQKQITNVKTLDILSHESINRDPHSVYSLFAELSKFFIGTFNAKNNDLLGNQCDISILENLQYTKRRNAKLNVQKSSSQTTEKSPQLQGGWNAGDSDSSSSKTSIQGEENESYENSSEDTQGDWRDELNSINAVKEKSQFESVLPESYYILRNWPHITLYDVAICVWLNRSAGGTEEQQYCWIALQLAKKAVNQIIRTGGANAPQKFDNALLAPEFPFGLTAFDCLYAQTPRTTGLFGDVKNRLETLQTRLGTQPTSVDFNKFQRFTDAFYGENSNIVHQRSKNEQITPSSHQKVHHSSVLATSDVQPDGAMSPKSHENKIHQDILQDSHNPLQNSKPNLTSVLQMPKLTLGPEDLAMPSESIHQIQPSLPNKESHTQITAALHQGLPQVPPPQLIFQNSQLQPLPIQPPINYIHPQVPTQSHQQHIPTNQQPETVEKLEKQEVDECNVDSNYNKPPDLMHDPLAGDVHESVPAVPLVPVMPAAISTGRHTRNRRQLSSPPNQNVSVPYIPPQQQPVFVPTQVTDVTTDTPEPDQVNYYEKEQSSSAEFDNIEPEDDYNFADFKNANESVQLEEHMYEIPKPKESSTVSQQKAKQDKEKKDSKKKEKLEPATGKKLSLVYSETYKRWVQKDKDGNEIPPEAIGEVPPPPKAAGFS